MIASLQPGLTVKQAAEVMNVSERSVYNARRLRKSGREDLFAAVEAGKMSLHKALKLAYPDQAPPKKNGLPNLKRAWRAATEDERLQWLEWVRLETRRESDDA